MLLKLFLTLKNYVSLHLYKLSSLGIKYSYNFHNILVILSSFNPENYFWSFGLKRFQKLSKNRQKLLKNAKTIHGTKW